MENIGMEGNISELSATHHWAMYTCTFGHWLYYKKTYWSSKIISILHNIIMVRSQCCSKLCMYREYYVLQTDASITEKL